MKTLRTLLFAGLAAAMSAHAAEPPAPVGERDQAVEPTVERRAVDAPHIGARDIELGAYVGVLNLDQFGSQPVYGVRLGYHLTEDFVLEASVARSKVSDARYRRFGLPLFDSEEEDVDYGQLTLVFNALPGELFAGRRYAYRSGLFLGAGIGKIQVADDDRFNVNLGAGLRLLASDSVLLRLDLRSLIYETDVLGKSEMTYNLEATAGLGYYF